MSDLLEIQVEGPPLTSFYPDRERLNFGGRTVTNQECRPRASSSTGESSSCGGHSSSEVYSTDTEEALSLDDWDALFDSD